MSNKYIIFFTSVFLILGTQSNIVRADYLPLFIDNEIEAAESMKVMRSFLDFDKKKMPLSKFESKSLMKDYPLMAQKALDKEEIPGFGKSSFVSKELDDEITKFKLAKQVQFLRDKQESTSKIRDTLKRDPWKENLGKWLEKMGPDFPTYYNGFEIPD